MSISDDLGIYIGSATAYGCIHKRGIVFCEPALVAVEPETGKILNAGFEAEEVLKHAKIHSRGIYPLADGRLTDYPTFERLVRHVIKRICGTRTFKPRVALCLPDGFTNVERRAAEEAVLSAGGRSVAIVSKMLAAGYGVGVKPDDAQGKMIIHLGGGCTAYAFLASGNVILSETSNLSQNKINSMIYDYIRDKYDMIISGETAESIKNNLGCFYPRDFNLKMNITGKHVTDGTPAYLTVDSNEIYGVMQPAADEFLQMLAKVLKKIPAHFLKAIAKDGVVLTGGGSLLYGIEKLIFKSFSLPAVLDKNAERSVADGFCLMLYTGKLFKQSER